MKTQDFPLCDACRLPMKVGQVRRHYVCRPDHPAFDPSAVDRVIRAIEPIPFPFDVGMDRSQDAAEAGWTQDQIHEVDRAILRVADRLDSFTADDIWEELGSGFPVTKGLAARLVSAQRRELITSTDRTRRSARGGAHDHGQRLTVWISLSKKGLFS